MNQLIDVVCPACGHVAIDVWLVERVYPVCVQCGVQTERAWLSAASITPQGTRPERNTDRRRPQKADTKKIAAETKFEIEQKWLRHSNDALAEQAVSREINHKAGIADDMGNPLPIPKPPPITFPNPMTAAAA